MKTRLKKLKVFYHQIIEQWDEEDKVKLVLEIVSKQNPDVLRFTASFIRFTELQGFLPHFIFTSYIFFSFSARRNVRLSSTDVLV